MPAAEVNSASSHAEDMVEAFRKFLSEEGLKTTRQRELIVRVFAGIEDHVGVEELLQRVKRQDPAIGYATVYRTLKLLVQGGLAAVRNFGDGFARFEPRGHEHHDHMICEKCGAIVEFHNEEIERLQEQVAREHGFVLRRHRHELYGLCESCQ
jgi:Fur family ferric uptake transcriptional regulator